MSTTTTAAPLTDALGWGHERVHIVHDRESELQAVIAIHSTVLGPSLGGMRIRAYAGGLGDALDDALRLSRAMTLKASAAGLDLGGGKAVVLDDGRAELRRPRLAAMAREIEQLEGAYITAEDVGTTTDDMDFIATQTEFVVGRSPTDGRGGDPSPDTAATVLGGIRAAFEALGEGPDLAGRRVGVIGLGKVGGCLAGLLVAAGAEVVGYDPSAAARESCRDKVEPAASAEAILGTELDVLAPCALGGIVDAEVARGLRCRVLCGAANNPLTRPEVGTLLAERDILYVPDFLANCGGLIHADAERLAERGACVETSLQRAEERTREVMEEALSSGRSPAAIAEERAWSRIRAAETDADQVLGD